MKSLLYFLKIFDFIQTYSYIVLKNNLVQFLFLAFLASAPVEGFGVPPPRNFEIISLMSMSPPSLGNCRFSISFLVSGSFMIFGKRTSRIRGKIIIKTIGEKRKSVTFHCSRVWKYLKVVTAFNFNGYGT